MRNGNDAGTAVPEKVRRAEALLVPGHTFVDTEARAAWTVLKVYPRDVKVRHDWMLGGVEHSRVQSVPRATMIAFVASCLE